jgi:hypothetical protein
MLQLSSFPIGLLQFEPWLGVYQSDFKTLSTGRSSVTACWDTISYSKRSMLLSGGMRGIWQDEFWEEIENSVRYDIQARGVPCLILRDTIRHS